MSASPQKYPSLQYHPSQQLQIVCSSTKQKVIEIIYNEILNQVFQMLATQKIYHLGRNRQELTLKNQIKKQNKFASSKKRIGNYFYYLNDCIGNGYSSEVFKAYKNDNKNFIYAIKVIKLAKMNQGHHKLLQNQIHILGQLNHPNIIKLYDAFFTENHCYIITDYCQGGTLQNHIQSNPKLNWKQVFIQLLQGCKYLQKKLIIHRDIKPANIFKKNCQWKIGDFGFARFIPHKNAQIQEIFMIGSPLYMPPQTLQKNIYSLKTDSFAFGILFFHLVTKQFPWYGNTKREITQSYTSKQYPIDKLKHISNHFQIFFKGLCQIEIIRRLYISDYQQQKLQSMQTTKFATPTSSSSCLDLVNHLTPHIHLSNIQKLKLCKFIYYIDSNIQHFGQMCQISQNLRRLIKFLSLIFQWDHNASYTEFMEQFLCKNYKEFTSIEQLQHFRSLLEIGITDLQGSLLRRCQILRLKLIQLSFIISLLPLPNQNASIIKNLLNGIVLHSDFSKVLISPQQIQEIQNIRENHL